MEMVHSSLHNKFPWLIKPVANNVVVFWIPHYNVYSQQNIVHGAMKFYIYCIKFWCCSQVADPLMIQSEPIGFKMEICFQEEESKNKKWIYSFISVNIYCTWFLCTPRHFYNHPFQICAFCIQYLTTVFCKQFLHHKFREVFNPKKKITVLCTH